MCVCLVEASCYHAYTDTYSCQSVHSRRCFYGSILIDSTFTFEIKPSLRLQKPATTPLQPRSCLR